MISEQKWFRAKYGNVPSFTAQIRRQEKHYGQQVETRRGWFKRNITYIIFLITGFGAVVCFAAALLLTFYLLPGAIEAELDRQLAVVEQQIKGGQR